MPAKCKCVSMLIAKEELCFLLGHFCNFYLKTKQEKPETSHRAKILR
jgi:hypothetical protein